MIFMEKKNLHHIFAEVRKLYNSKIINFENIILESLSQITP